MTFDGVSWLDLDHHRLLLGADLHALRASGVEGTSGGTFTGLGISPLNTIFLGLSFSSSSVITGTEESDILV